MGKCFLDTLNYELTAKVWKCLWTWNTVSKLWNIEIFGDSSLASFTSNKSMVSEIKIIILISSICTALWLHTLENHVGSQLYGKEKRNPEVSSPTVIQLEMSQSWETSAPGNPQVKGVNWKTSISLLINQGFSKILNNLVLGKTSNQL